MKITLKRLVLYTSVGVIIVFCASQIFERVEAQKNSRYNEFSHSTKAHKKDCNSCHKVPSGNWRAAGAYPNITDYPDHASCVGCHRQQFFSGNRPAICTICHVQSSPRGKARMRFPIRSGSQEFRTNFPHSVHQDIIAENKNLPVVRSARNVRVGYAISFDDDDKKPAFNNCAICHQTRDSLPAFGDRRPVNTESLASPDSETFRPQSDFFKNSPNSHASCFSCHYQSQKPIASDCASCHLLTPAHFESNVTTRYSLKFRHEDDNHSNKDCTICHIRITQSSDLLSLVGADVPILTCSTSSCHGKELKAEITKRADSVAKKQPIFQCNYCHTSGIGSYDVPQSHQ